MDSGMDSAVEPITQLVEGLWPGFEASWIVHQDADLVVVNKPAGISCQAADSAHPDDLVMRLRAHLAQQRGVDPKDVYLGVHQRLDRDTSGLVLYTLRAEANGSIARQFGGRTLDKRYVAIVEPYNGADRETLVHTLAPGRDGRMEVVPDV